MASIGGGLSQPYEWLIEQLLPRAKWFGKFTYDCDGAFFPHSVFLYEPQNVPHCKSRNQRQIAFARMTLKAAIESAGLLGVDAALASRWQGTLAKLPDYHPNSHEDHPNISSALHPAGLLPARRCPDLGPAHGHDHRDELHGRPVRVSGLLTSGSENDTAFWEIGWGNV